MEATDRNKTSTRGGGGSIAQWLVFALTDPGIPESFWEKIFRENIVDVAKVNRQHC